MLVLFRFVFFSLSLSLYVRHFHFIHLIWQRERYPLNSLLCSFLCKYKKKLLFLSNLINIRFAAKFLPSIDIPGYFLKAGQIFEERIYRDAVSKYLLYQHTPVIINHGRIMGKHAIFTCFIVIHRCWKNCS